MVPKVFALPSLLCLGHTAGACTIGPFHRWIRCERHPSFAPVFLGHTHSAFSSFAMQCVSVFDILEALSRDPFYRALGSLTFSCRILACFAFSMLLQHRVLGSLSTREPNIRKSRPSGLSIVRKGVWAPWIHSHTICFFWTMAPCILACGARVASGIVARANGRLQHA